MNKLQRHIKRNYATLNDGYSVKVNSKFRDEFRLASHDDKWDEYLGNIRKIERDGRIWTRQSIERK